MPRATLAVPIWLFATSAFAFDVSLIADAGIRWGLFAFVLLLILGPIGALIMRSRARKELARRQKQLQQDDKSHSTSIGLHDVSSGDDNYYEQALMELDSSEPIKATWARAFTEANGDEKKAKAAYIRMRVEQFSAQDAATKQRELTLANEERNFAKRKLAKKQAGYRWTGAKWGALVGAFSLSLLVIITARPNEPNVLSRVVAVGITGGLLGVLIGWLVGAVYRSRQDL